LSVRNRRLGTTRTIASYARAGSTVDPWESHREAVRCARRRETLLSKPPSPRGELAAHVPRRRGC
jgi:hypothetical protein